MNKEKKSESKLSLLIPKGPLRILLPVFLILGVVLIFLGNLPESEKKSEENEEILINMYSERLEKRIGELVLSLDGIENVNVFLTLDSTTRYIYATDNSENISSGSSSKSSDLVIISSGGEEHPINVSQICPVIRGVSVVCTGGDNIDIKKTVVDLLSAALGIPTNKIVVAKWG